MSLALTVQMKIMTAVVEGLQSAEREPAREAYRTLPGIPAPARSSNAWRADDRFVFLRDWVTINFLGIGRRASKERFCADDVLAMIPPYLQPEVALVDDAVVTIGTRDHSDHLVVPRSPMKKFSEYRSWFESDARSLQPAPAIVRPLAPGFEVVMKGRLPATDRDKKQHTAQFIIITRKPASTPGKTIWDVL